MTWIDIWEEEPPRNEEILFLIGKGDIHFGTIYGTEKLRKCTFYSFCNKNNYSCDASEEYQYRVVYWCPVPKCPELLNSEDYDKT